MPVPAPPDRAVPRGPVLLLAAGIGLLFVGQVMSWGYAPIDVEVGWWFRPLFALAPLLLVGGLVVDWLEPDTARRSTRVVISVLATVAAAVCFGLAVVLFRDYLEPHWGGWLLAASEVVIAAAAVLLAVPRRRFVAETVGAVLVAVTVVVGVVWWPTISIRSSTGPGVRGESAAGSRVGAVVDTGSYGFAGVFGGRPVVTRYDGCGRSVQGLDPSTGSVAWSYARRTCAGTVGVTGNDHVIQLRYTVYRGAPPSLYVYLDPRTGREIHPGSLDDRITDWVGDYGLLLTADTGTGGVRGVVVVDPRTGSVLAGGSVAPCPSGWSQRLAIADGVFARADVLGARLALPYGCVNTAGATPHPVQQHLLIISLPGGKSTDVRLPASAATRVQLDSVRNDDNPIYPLVRAAGDVFVVGYQTDRSAPGESYRRLVGVEPTGRIRWNTTADRSASAGPATDFAQVGSALLTSKGVLDPSTGRISAYPVKNTVVPSGGGTIGDGYVAVAGLEQDTMSMRVFSADGAVRTITVRDPALRGLRLPRGDGELSVTGTAGGVCVAGADSVALLRPG